MEGRRGKWAHIFYDGEGVKGELTEDGYSGPIIRVVERGRGGKRNQHTGSKKSA